MPQQVTTLQRLLADRLRMSASVPGLTRTGSGSSRQMPCGFDDCARHYSDLYKAVPEKINVTVQGILEKIRSVAAAEAESRGPLAGVFDGCRSRRGRVRGDRKGLRDLLKWSAIVSAAGLFILGGVFVSGYWLGFDHGRARGFNAGVEGHLAASWALSVDGLRAYGLWQGGDLGHWPPVIGLAGSWNPACATPRPTKGSCMVGAFGETGRKSNATQQVER